MNYVKVSTYFTWLSLMVLWFAPFCPVVASTTTATISRCVITGVSIVIRSSVACAIFEVVSEDEVKFFIGEMVVLGQDVVDLIDDGLGFAGVDGVAAGGAAFEMA